MNKQSALVYFLSRKSSRLSENTLLTYEKSISSFLFNTNHKLKELVLDDYIFWEEAEYEKGKERTTLSTNRASVKAFIRFCLDEEIITSNPLTGLGRSKLKKTVPRYLDAPTVQAIKDAAMHCLRDSAIIDTLLVTGVRVSELISIQKSDYNKGLRQIHIRESKDLEERMVPITAACRERIEQYLSSRQDESPYLFVNTRGGKMTRQGILFLVKQYAEIGKVKVNVTVHSFRHTFAHNLAKAGAPLDLIAKLLGHKKLEMARRYTGPTNK